MTVCIRVGRLIAGLGITACFAIGAAGPAACAAEKGVGSGAEHWAFRRISRPAVPTLKHPEAVRSPVDAFLLAPLEAKKLSLGPPAGRETLLRRLSFDLTGLPPTLAETAQFVADGSAEAYPRAVERLLASPHYGERWGKYWLDVAGYADSNGYFNADSDRPFAYRYRDYVIRAWNADKPFDKFVREQLAGDELSGYAAGKEITPRVLELFTATHFLRNSQDGTSESDGNPDELTVDRSTVLQGSLQITMNGLLGLTIQCCRCHEHKFEPIQHAEYYRLQSVFYPAFPAYDAAHWVKPRVRITEMPTPAERAGWEEHRRELDSKAKEAAERFSAWVAAHRPYGAILFRDDFAEPGRLKLRWSNRAPGDDAAGGVPPVGVDSAVAPGAAIENGSLAIISGGGSSEDRWLVTKSAFDWTPAREGEWIQASFTLIADRVGKGPAAERVAYFIAAHDFNKNGSVRGGDILFDGNPAGGAAVHVGYPGPQARLAGEIGQSGYRPGRRYGVRVTNVGGGKFRLEQIVDFAAENKAVTLAAADLPDGAFGFEYCGERSFVVDDVIIETSDPHGAAGAGATGGRYRKEYAKREKGLRRALAEIESARRVAPGSLASVTDLLEKPPATHLLKRGDFKTPGEAVVPAGLAVLCDGSPNLPVSVPYPGSHSTGRRLAFARWLTGADSRASALLARVIVNRIWQRHFGKGIVATPDNFGLSGSRPSHPELIEFLAAELKRSGWSIKTIHRLIVLSAAYRQSSAPRADGLAADPSDRLLWRYPLQRLDADAIRDAMLAVSGDLAEGLYGSYVPINREEDGSIIVREQQPGAHRRSIYLQQRRTQVNTLLELFDAPVMVSNCAVRGTSTVPLQSLALLNSAFVRARAASFARGARTASPDAVRRAISCAFGREPTAAEQNASIAFLKEQSQGYVPAARGGERAWDDFCQMLLASNAFLYVE